MKRNLLHVADDEQQPRQRPRISRRVRVAAQIHLVAQEHIFHIVGVQRVDERVLRLGEINVVVALNRLIQERQPDDEHQPQAQEQRFAVYAGFHRGVHRNTGLRAAVTSSTRLVRV